MSDKSQEEKTILVPRITQLDANELDKEIHNVLVSQLMEVSKYLKPGALNNVKLELSLILDLLIFYYSVITRNTTFGQELLRLKYKNVLTKNQLTVYALINYVLPYMSNKCENNLGRIENTSINNFFTKMDVFIKVCKFLNSLLFLREGKYPTIADRILKLKYCPVNKLNNSVGYNYMTRELLWHGFMELFMYVLPLINYKSIKRRIRKPFHSKSSKVKNIKSINIDCETKCVICEDHPNLPCQISKYCSHTACYYCIKSNVLADEKFMCPLCGETNTANENLVFLGS